MNVLTNDSPTALAEQRKWISVRTVRTYGMIFALIVLWIALTLITDGVFIEPRNLSNLMRQTAVTGVLAVGMVMVIVAGQIDLSVGSLVGLSGMVAVLVQASFHWSLTLSLLAGVIAGLLAATLQGVLIVYAQVPSFIVTLGGLLAWRGVTKGLSGGNTYPIEIPAFKSIGQSYVSGSVGIILAAISITFAVAWTLRHSRARRFSRTPRSGSRETAIRVLFPVFIVLLFFLVLNQYSGVPVPVVIFFFLASVGAFLMEDTVFGRHLYAIGGNQDAARLSGINLNSHVLVVFTILGGLAAIAGIVYTARVGSAGPDAGTLLELDAIAACVIGGASLMGGRGTVFGACLGALFMTSLDNGMSLKNVPDFTQDIVKGGVLVSAVALDMLGRRSRRS